MINIIDEKEIIKYKKGNLSMLFIPFIIIDTSGTINIRYYKLFDLTAFISTYQYHNYFYQTIQPFFYSLQTC